MADSNTFNTQRHNPNDKVASPAQVMQLVMAEAQRRGLTWFNQTHAAGMVGSFMQETGSFIRDVIESKWLGDNGSAHGLMQWRGNRYSNLLEYSQANGLNPNDIISQIQFAFEETLPSNQTRYSDSGSVRALRDLRSARSIDEAATAFIHAERPAGYGDDSTNSAFSAHDRQGRIDYATQAATDFAGGDLQNFGVSTGGQYNSTIPPNSQGSQYLNGFAATQPFSQTNPFGRLNSPAPQQPTIPDQPDTSKLFEGPRLKFGKSVPDVSSPISNLSVFDR